MRFFGTLKFRLPRVLFAAIFVDDRPLARCFLSCHGYFLRFGFLTFRFSQFSSRRTRRILRVDEIERFGRSLARISPKEIGDCTEMCRVIIENLLLRRVPLR